MPRRIITVGDRHDHGGTVITGSGGLLHCRRNAVLHDLVDCPRHGINRIVEATGPCPHGQRAACEGDRAECGCRLIGRSRATVVK